MLEGVQLPEDEVICHILTQKLPHCLHCVSVLCYFVYFGSVQV